MRIPFSTQISLNALKSIFNRLIKRPETPLTPSLLRILRISLSSMVSVTTTHWISVTFTTELRSSRCIKIISVLYSSIRCCCLNSASKSFSETAIRSLPNLWETSLISSIESGFEKFSMARLAPA